MSWHEVLQWLFAFERGYRQCRQQFSHQFRDGQIYWTWTWTCVYDKNINRRIAVLSQSYADLGGGQGYHAPTQYKYLDPPMVAKYDE